MTGFIFLLSSSFDVIQDHLGSLFRSHSAGVDFDIIFTIAVHFLELGSSKSNFPVASIKFSPVDFFQWAMNSYGYKAQGIQAIQAFSIFIFAQDDVINNSIEWWRNEDWE